MPVFWHLQTSSYAACCEAVACLPATTLVMPSRRGWPDRLLPGVLLTTVTMPEEWAQKASVCLGA